MRTAVISDIHGNLPALESVLSDIEKESIDSVICLGDIATLGPSPSEVIQLVKGLNCPCIVGNHEEALLNPEAASSYAIKGELLQQTLYWCLDKISEADLSFIKTFKQTLTVPLLGGGNAFYYHGSPDSSTGIINEKTGDNELGVYLNGDSSILLAVGGHTHVQMYRPYNEAVFVNPGSVGCAFKEPSIDKTPSILPIAEYAIIKSENNGSLSVEQKRIKYNTSEYINQLKSSDLPLKEWWLDEFKKIGLS